jgi:hypothetical protein
MDKVLYLYIAMLFLNQSPYYTEVRQRSPMDDGDNAISGFSFS